VCNDYREKRREAELERIRKQREAERRAREEHEKELRRQIREHFDLPERPPIDVNQLSFHDVIYLTSILRAGACEDLTKVVPLALLQQPLTPTQEFTAEIVSYLYDRHLIFVRPDTEPEAFPEGDTSVFYTWRV
jgi:hypothetical protein